MKRESWLGTRDSALLAETLTHLRVLVGYDTRNPPRAIGSEGMFDYLRAQLPGFKCVLADHGAGALSLFAVRGKPRLLFNVHLDTVPDSPQWSANPFELRIEDERAIGLGACDIKGAAAALLAIANATQGDLALLFSTDEEGRDPRCIASFLTNASGVPAAESRAAAFEAIVVAEPTRGEAVLAHRGVHSVQVGFTGRAGHASNVQHRDDSAVHQALRWGHAALEFAQAQAHQRFGGLTGLRFNIGRIEGGIKANMIASSAQLQVGLRPLPSMDADALLKRLRDLTDPAPARFEETFRGPSLPAGADFEGNLAGAETRRLAARDLVDELGLAVGNAVDFWTEAALFSQAGYIAFVYGPGDIAQAHAADEWVALGQLRAYAESIRRLVEAGLT
ncbi:MAG TPA: acetylornithine deacetylase [Rhodanobacteraceae bacterium]|nr:acetylornithine deacetylase [Rhodanobacteraceae bacterium]